MKYKVQIFNFFLIFGYVNSDFKMNLEIVFKVGSEKSGLIMSKYREDNNLEITIEIYDWRCF